MDLIDDRDSGEFTNPVVSVTTLRIELERAAALLGETLASLAEVETKSLPGFLSAEVLLSVDNETVLILSEWTNRHAWGKSRYDPIVESLIKDFYADSAAIEFEVYTRRAHSPRRAS
jgi:heme-degrading monooxygenase HmoA